MIVLKKVPSIRAKLAVEWSHIASTPPPPPPLPLPKCCSRLAVYLGIIIYCNRPITFPLVLLLQMLIEQMLNRNSLQDMLALAANYLPC